MVNVWGVKANVREQAALVLQICASMVAQEDDFNIDDALNALGVQSLKAANLAYAAYFAEDETISKCLDESDWAGVYAAAEALIRNEEI